MGRTVLQDKASKISGGRSIKSLSQLFSLNKWSNSERTLGKIGYCRAVLTVFQHFTACKTARSIAQPSASVMPLPRPYLPLKPLYNGAYTGAPPGEGKKFCRYKNLTPRHQRLSFRQVRSICVNGSIDYGRVMAHRFTSRCGCHRQCG